MTHSRQRRVTTKLLGRSAIQLKLELYLRLIPDPVRHLFLIREWLGAFLEASAAAINAEVCGALRIPQRFREKRMSYGFPSGLGPRSFGPYSSRNSRKAAPHSAPASLISSI